MLELSFVFVPKTISEFIAEVSAVGDNSQKLSKLEDYVKRLEEEKRKIDAFKRELPLSVLLVKDAIERLKEEEKAIKRSEEKEEGLMMMMPLKRKKSSEIGGGGAKSESDFSDKRNWMSSAQLWTSSNVDSDPDKQTSSVLNLKPGSEEVEEEKRSQVCEKVIGGVSNYRCRGGAFVPFKVGGGGGASQSQVPSLSLMTPMADELGGGSKTNDINYSNSKTSHNSSSTSTTTWKGVSGSNFLTNHVKLVSKPQTQQQQQQPLRKQRRTWNEDLHSRFLDALKQLGGSQVATPKQIRELMKVEGITNDEVKSHLQKYRLHVRKLPNSSSAQAGNGLWMAQDHSGDNSKANNMNMSQSSSPHGPLGASGSNKALSNTGGDITEAEEDEKSDGHSWRGGGGGKRRAGEEDEDV